MSVETAPLVEAALGEKTQHVVIQPGKRLPDYLAAHGKRLSGRVGFLTLDNAAAPHGNWISATNSASSVGQTGSSNVPRELTPLIHRLLGGTWIVENLSQALALADAASEKISFVTLAGDYLAADGTLVVGQRQASSGLISRRSELRALAHKSHNGNTP